MVKNVLTEFCFFYTVQGFTYSMYQYKRLCKLSEYFREFGKHLHKGQFCYLSIVLNCILGTFLLESELNIRINTHHECVRDCKMQ